jgi:DNA polymerase-3 subunit chi
VSGAQGEIWFYQLERSTLDQVLPELLDRTLQRGWRARVRVADADQRREIDEQLWTWREDSFLAHGMAYDDHAGRQPILLTADSENLNRSQALFIVDQSDMTLNEEFERCFIIFDGRDEAALATARARWKALKDQGANLAYWKQSEAGRWERAS